MTESSPVRTRSVAPALVSGIEAGVLSHANVGSNPTEGSTLLRPAGRWQGAYISREPGSIPGSSTWVLSSEVEHSVETRVALVRSQEVPHGKEVHGPFALPDRLGDPAGDGAALIRRFGLVRLQDLVPVGIVLVFSTAAFQAARAS